MSKIYFRDGLIWDRPHLPNEKEAERIFRTYVHHSNEEMEIALSCGIDVKTPEGVFSVVLTTDNEKWARPCQS